METELSPEKKLIIYGMYCNYIKDIKHFDVLQTYFRILSSTILLASFAAIGFLYSIETSHLPFTRSFAVVIVTVIGGTSIFTLWHVDLLFYERLLVSNFAEAFRLEKEQDWLPRVHHNMLYGIHKQDHPSNIVYYYIGCISSLILTAGLSISFIVYYIHHMSLVAIGIILATFAIIFISYFTLRKKTKKISSLMLEIKYVDKE